MKRPAHRLAVLLALCAFGLAGGRAQSWQPPPPDLEMSGQDAPAPSQPAQCLDRDAAAVPALRHAAFEPATAATEALTAQAVWQRCSAASAGARHVCLHQWLSGCG